MSNTIAVLKNMKNKINLDKPGIFCQNQYYDTSDAMNEAVMLKRAGEYVLSFYKYMEMYSQTGKLSLCWVRGAFKTLACGGAIMEAYDLLTACTNYFMDKDVYNEKTELLRVHQVSIALCALGYLRIGNYKEFRFNNYLRSLSGMSAYVMPDLSGELSDITVGFSLLMHMNMYEQKYPNLVQMAKVSLRNG